MKVYKIYPKGFASNSYILTQDGLNAVIIDCAQPSVLEECVKLNLIPRFVLLTHGHYDHIGGCAMCYNVGTEIICSKEEEQIVYHPFNKDFGCDLNFKINKHVSDGEKFSLCGIDFIAIATPGHSVGSMCYIAEDCLFSGDTLFFESIGRWDLPTGNGRQLEQSIKKLFSLPKDYVVYCGHEDNTTLSHEKINNAYVRP
ncbi:MAG: MBL fold metallo-hydrolase [Clostridiales bacterium]|nr:MBL fold metallo-hydrolase [Clostridiales bacterium]